MVTRTDRFPEATRYSATPEGVLLLDKPAGMTSNAALQAVRRLFGGVKAGHTGTLDPLATGLLPVCLGQATKFAGGLLEADKTYEALIHLGVATTTGDAEGTPVFQGNLAGCLERVPEILVGFEGEIDQMPPMFSALKHHGRPLYSYARAGEEVERKTRRITVIELTLLTLSRQEVSVRVRCTKGTYIRTLAHDIGERLGCGAHLKGLRRTAIGPLTVEHAIGLHSLLNLPVVERGAWIHPADLLLAELPAVILDSARTEAVLNGRPVIVTEQMPLGLVRLYSRDGGFLGLGSVGGEGLLSPKRMRAGGFAGQPAAECDVT